MSQPQGLAVDSEGRIYVASGFYHRVQVYDAEGRYLRGWFLPHGHKNFRLRIGEDQALEAVASGRLFRFDPSGVELSSRGETTSTFDSTPKHSFTTPTHHYEVRDLASPEVSIYPRVVRFGPQGPETVVTSPWLLWPVQGVFPAFGWAVLGMALLGLRRFGRVDRLS